MTYTVTRADVWPLVCALRARRLQLGIRSVREVEHKAGFSDALIEHYERGARVPSLLALQLWARALGADLGIVTEEDRRPERAEIKKALALLHLCEGKGLRVVARMLNIPPSTIVSWRKAVQGRNGRKMA